MWILQSWCLHGDGLKPSQGVSRVVTIAFHFSVACACLALSSSDQRSIVEAAWRESANETKIDMMRALQCCGFRQTDLPPSDPLGNPPCKLALLPCCSTSQGQRAACCQGHVNSSDLISPCPCTTSCWTVVQAKLERGIRVTGTVGVFFSIIELIGVWLALQYRHKRDPSFDPNSVR
ncbi:unnamed protein product [Calicophoron daubneyi]|uniref:Tetraspanin-13 n=1 Tax=Calicophoron daubneyi TaxID=300641 RepID=A0AAV2T7G7_CALDB